jgi:hypothetical protein
MREFPLAATEEKKSEKAMTYHELVEKVRTALVVKADASKIEDHIAVQVNVTGEAEGAFYIEIKDGALCVEPYTYNDRDFQLTGDGADVLAVAQGKKSLEAAVGEGILAHEGDWDKTLVLSNIIPAAKKNRKKTVKEEVKAEEPAEGQLAFAEEAPAEEKPKKTTKKSSSTTKTKSTSKTKEASKTKTTRKTKETPEK